jgi:hypothetical protein
MLAYFCGIIVVPLGPIGGDLNDNLAVPRPYKMRRSLRLGEECARRIGLELGLVRLVAEPEVECAG